MAPEGDPVYNNYNFMSIYICHKIKTRYLISRNVIPSVIFIRMRCAAMHELLFPKKFDSNEQNVGDVPKMLV